MYAFPLVGLISPVNILKVVVFPAPFKPNRPKHSFGEIPKLMLSTALNTVLPL
jgi:hypothetical protein